MKKSSIIMAVLSCAIIAAAYTNSVPISTNTRAATEKWTAIRFEPALPPTPENAEANFLNGNREWQTAPAELDPVANAALAAHTNRADNPHGVTAPQIGALTNEQDLAALRAYHYGSPDIVESPAEWFVFDEAGTITAFNWLAGRTNVVIPWAIGGVPVTVIGASAFQSSGIVSVIAPQTVTSIEDYAFIDCTSLASVLFPAAQTFGGSAFGSCTSLASVLSPAAQTFGDSAFGGCTSLIAVSLPQVQTVAAYAFGSCTSLASVYFDNDAPTIGTDIFAGIPPNQVTNYVTNPQATGWGATLGGMPVVRPPLYGSNVTAQAFTLGGDTITEWPSGGGETSIIAPLIASGTNITVTSTQSVYSVAVTGAGPVGIDWSGLSLDGTGRAEITLRLNVTEWGGTNITFSPSLTFDRTPEILVTGVWEFAASTIDGVTTRVRQTYPEVYAWTSVTPNAAMFGNASFYYGGGSNPSLGTQNGGKLFYPLMTAAELLLRLKFSHAMTAQSAGTSLAKCKVSSGLPTAFILTNVVQTSVWNSQLPPRFAIIPASVDNATLYGEHVILERVVDAEDNTAVHLMLNLSYRQLNANERAAYEAGWRP